MRVNEAVRKCICFVGFRMADGSFRFAGSAFWLGRDKSGEAKASPVYLITARHVIDSIRAKGLREVWLRLNHTDGTSKWFSSALDQWFVHDSDKSIDVAILPAGIPEGFDHLLFRTHCASRRKG